MALSLQSFNPCTGRSLETVNKEYKLDKLYNRLSEDPIDTPRRKTFFLFKFFISEKYRYLCIPRFSNCLNTIITILMGLKTVTF